MKFKRINVDTVRCLISEEELWANGLEVEDFLQNDGKTEEFLRKIISLAAQEVGYKIRGGNLSIQVSVLPDHVLALTFSEKQDIGLVNMLEYLKHAMENFSQNVREEAQNEENKTVQTDSGANDGAQRDLPEESRADYQICFDSLDAFEAYSKSVMVEVPVANCLYKLESENSYFLLLQKESMTDKQLCRLLGASLEFASAIYSNSAIEAFIREHGVELIAQEAIQRMQNL